MKKLTSVLIGLCLILVCLTLLTTDAQAVEIIASGKCGENLTWTLDSNGLLTISGTGAMSGWDWYLDKLWYSNQSSVKTVVIENGVTSIGDSAFSDCSSLTSVTIPESVTRISYSAFSYCSSLTSITIPDSVTSIGDNAFRFCSSLTSITIPDSVTSIGDSVFSSCSSLTFITIPNGVTSIGDSAFYECSKLTSITIPDSVASIGKRAFNGCSSLTSITIPNSVTSIGGGAFNGCSSLTSIVVSNNNTKYSSDASGVLFNKDQTELICCPGGKEGSYIIPSSVTSIGDDAFSYCSSLTSISIPNSVTSIGDSAFSYCSSLTSVTIPDSVTSIGDSAFYECSKLTSVIIPDSVTSIGASAFEYCKSLNTITIPDSVASIGKYAFVGCSSLTSVIFMGSAPSFEYTGAYDSEFFVHATAFYPCSDASWTESWSLVDSYILTWKKNHNCVGGTVERAATCTEDEVVSGLCKDCNQNVICVRPNTATGHSLGPNNGCTACGLAGDIIINLHDSDGDGWNGNALKVYENGVLLTSATISSGSSHQVTVSYYSGRVYTFQWIAGNFSYECSFDITLQAQKRFMATGFDCVKYTDGQAVYTLDSNCQHSYQSSVTYPTLTANGYTTLTCKDCGYSYVESYTFPDVPKSLWSYEAIEYAVAKGYFSGYQSGKFGPTDNISRQDFVVVLARIAGVDLKKYSGRTSFPDVKAGSYYEAAVKWASSTGVVSGYNNGTFGVNDKITREQLVTILYRFAQKKGYDTKVSSGAAAKLAKFADAGKVTSYAKTAVIWALDKGIISGMTSTTVAPQNNASRGQVATILMNISKKNIMPI